MAQQTYGEYMRSNPPIPTLTAVEWFVGQINLYLHDGWDKEEFTVRVPKDLVERAKQMEKEQISQGYMAGLIDGMYRPPREYEQPREYYNETYGEK